MHPADSPVGGLTADIADGPAGPHIGAFFDLDGTLVHGYTAAVHMRHRVKTRQAHLGELTGTAEAALSYRFGRVRFAHLLTRAAGYLRGESLAELEELGELLFERHIEARIYDGMRQIVAAHRERGHTLVLSSSALTIHARSTAQALGIPHLICNHFVVDEDERLTGAIVAPIIWGKRKAEAVREFSAANDLDLAGSYFYADGHEDLPLMREVGHPCAVNPRPRLAAAAVENGWPMLRLNVPSRRRMFGVRSSG
jgi:HAD superfamily hydrolase (TIGR01490 family)